MFDSFTSDHFSIIFLGLSQIQFLAVDHPFGDMGSAQNLTRY